MQSHYNHETGLTETDSDGEVPFAHRSAQLADIAGLALLALPGSRGEGAPSLDESEASATPDLEVMKIANLLSPDTETSLDDTRYQGTTDPRNTDVGRRHVGPPSFDPRTGYTVAENSLASPSTGPSNSISFTPINAHRPQRGPEPSSYWPANDLFVGAEKSDDSETPRERAINALRTAQMTFHEGVSKHLGPPSRRAGAKAITKARQNEASFATWQSSAPSAMAAVESLLQFIPQEAPVESDELTEDEKQHLAVWLRHNDEYQAKLSRSWRDGSWASFLPLAWLALRLSTKASADSVADQILALQTRTEDREQFKRISRTFKKERENLHLSSAQLGTFKALAKSAGTTMNSYGFLDGRVGGANAASAKRSLSDDDAE